jgi:hypothetical protein
MVKIINCRIINCDIIKHVVQKSSKEQQKVDVSTHKTDLKKHKKC